MNRVILHGRMTRDPEVRYTNGGSSVASFTVACDRRVKNGDKWEDSPDFPRCVSFGKTAEFIEKWFRKGSEIVVEGSVRTGSYTDKNGQKVYTTDIWVERAEFAGGNGERSAQQTQERPQQPAGQFVPVPDNFEEDGLPFS